jgi:hypothetical protein
MDDWRWNRDGSDMDGSIVEECCSNEGGIFS